MTSSFLDLILSNQSQFLLEILDYKVSPILTTFYILIYNFIFLTFLFIFSLDIIDNMKFLRRLYDYLCMFRHNSSHSYAFRHTLSAYSSSLHKNSKCTILRNNDA